jgi:hypothetical protein
VSPACVLLCHDRSLLCCNRDTSMYLGRKRQQAYETIFDYARIYRADAPLGSECETGGEMIKGTVEMASHSILADPPLCHSLCTENRFRFVTRRIFSVLQCRAAPLAQLESERSELPWHRRRVPLHTCDQEPLLQSPFRPQYLAHESAEIEYKYFQAKCLSVEKIRRVRAMR